MSTGCTNFMLQTSKRNVRWSAISIYSLNIKIMNSSYTSLSTKPLYRGTQIIWYILGIVEILLAFRFVLKLLGANPGAGFTSFIYGTTYVFANPFLSVFRSSQIVSGSIFEWTSILAMVVYWIIALGIINLFFMGKTVSTPEAAAKMDYQENK